MKIGIIKYEKSDACVMYLNDEPGGPIISGKTEKECIEKFMEAFKKYEVIKNVMTKTIIVDK